MGGAITARKRRNGCSSLLKHVETYMKIHHMRQKHKGIVLSQGMYSYCFKKNVYNIRYGHLFFPHVKLGCKIADDRGRTGKRSEPKWLLRRRKCE